MKLKYYTKLLLPICCFGFIFRILEIIFAVEAEDALYVPGSIIPTIFNAYCCIAILFFFSSLFLMQKGKKEVLRRFNKFGAFENIVFILAAIFMLSKGMKTFVFAMFADASMANITDILKTFSPYILVTSAFAALFLVQFVTAPRKIGNSPFWKTISLSLPIFYVISLFSRFTAYESIITKVYDSFDIIRMAMITMAVMNFSKIFINSYNRRFFLAFTLSSVFLSVIRLADMALSLVPQNPFNVRIDYLQVFADLFISIMLLLIIFRLNKKSKPSEKSLTTELANVPEKEELADDFEENIEETYIPNGKRSTSVFVAESETDEPEKSN